jgi:hypothetical protein
MGIKVKGKTVMGVFADFKGSRRNVASLRHCHSRHGLQQFDKLNIILTLGRTFPQRVGQSQVRSRINREALLYKEMNENSNSD